MRFGRVEGVVIPITEAGEARLRLTVHLDTGSRFEVVREETVAPLRPIVDDADLAWHADQFTQETIGVHLAEAGWEAVGVGEAPDLGRGELARSPTYTVRNLSSDRT